MRLRSYNAWLFAVVLSTGGSVLYADSINGSGSMQAWNSGSLVVNSGSPGAGTPYWNNGSGDGPKANVGWCIAGGGNCTMQSGPNTNLDYYGSSSSAAGMMYFNNTGAPVTITLQSLNTDQISTASGYDVFGYYLANGSGSAAGASLLPLFDTRTASVGSTSTIASIPANSNYGFYIENVQGGGSPFQSTYFYFMDSASNVAQSSMAADSYQHFATFTSGNGAYFIGDVDGDACQNGFQPGTSPCINQNEFDYNDVVVELTTGNSANIPEPASLALIGGGLCVLGAMLRRKKFISSEN